MKSGKFRGRKSGKALESYLIHSLDIVLERADLVSITMLLFMR